MSQAVRKEQTEAPHNSDVDKSYLRHRSILVIDDEHGIRNFLVKGLQKHSGMIESAADIDEAEALRRRCHFDLIIADIKLPGKSGVEWVKELREQGCTTSVILMTAHAQLDVAIDAIRVGASDFIVKPFRMDQMMNAIDRCIERQDMKRENFVLKRQVDTLYEGSGMIGECRLVQNLCATIKQIAPTPSKGGPI